jgi:uncharacterized membrane protein YczE
VSRLRLAHLVPSRNIPITRWRSQHRWRARPATIAILIIGLWLFGTGEAMLVNAGIGVSPWTVFAEGLAARLSLPIGMTTLLTSLAVLALWLPLRERPGLGTIANALVIALALQVMIEILPTPTEFGWQLALVIGGIASIGLGSGLYLTTNLGPGPRDGLMTGLHERTGIAVTPVRLTIEVLVLVAGWLLGGTVGLGTVMFALFIGPSVGYGLSIVGRIARSPGVVPAERGQPHPELEA